MYVLACLHNFWYRSKHKYCMVWQSLNNGTSTSIVGYDKLVVLVAVKVIMVVVNVMRKLILIVKEMMVKMVMLIS